ncbi:hypothetical protein KVF89_25440 [Nocardioides carbamazepini]|uniref:hypothetical protein n=1 Tax=Nocardioides carbamazepini TaxID=2854259 RepID=UPI002149FE7C|nr:hypothetical protein [Nocardioides carbamazepini]MCR1785904.1 hypothetical protein [Nocardioides carbamazepini]
MILAPRRAVVRGLCVAVLLMAATPAPGQAIEPATPSPQTDALCVEATVSCSVQVAPTWMEGRTAEVAVTGRSDVEVGVRAFRVTAADGRKAKLVPAGPAVRVSTDDNGFGRADLQLPAVTEDETGGPLLLALEDSTGADLATVLGTWTVLASRRPVVLGDGFGTAKPVGTPLRLDLTAALPGARFEVEIERDGQWQPVSSNGTTCLDAVATCSVGYEIPRGLDPVEHDVRLVDRASGTPVASWTVLPSEEGDPEARAPLPATHAVGAAVPGSVTEADGVASNPVPRPRWKTPDLPDAVGGAHSRGHSVATVHRASLTLVALAVLACLLGAATGMRRRHG